MARILKVIIDGAEHSVNEDVLIIDEVENARTTFLFDKTELVNITFFDNEQPIGEEQLDLTQMWETGTREY